ncbi:MAG: AAA family ATPase [Candidatus Omnitrophica bacterium]|jgi:AAA+ ATPase superfamily predicted ATPase|nr:AAA family ATPase [Candidatus Omnitrophota bacterium]
MFSDPVVGSLFFGREEILETLNKRVLAHRDGYRQNLAIIGEERLGKTSILLQHLHTSRDGRVLPVYIDLTSHSFDTFVQHFCRILLFQALAGADSGSEAAAATDWDALIACADKKIPQTASAAKAVFALLQKGDADKAYVSLLEMPTHVFRETNRRCVVILDEFHRLGDFPVKHAFQVFGKRLMVQKDTQYILLSSSVRLAREILAQKLALLFGHFERIDLGSFDYATSSRFIERSLEPAVMDAPTRCFVTASTDGHPFYLNVLTRLMREETERQMSGQVTRSMVFGAFKRALFDADGILNQCFVKRLSRWTDVRVSGSYRQMLLELGNGACRVKELALKIGRSQAECLRQLAALIEDDLVVKNGSLYSLPDQMFRFWISTVYRHRDLSLAVDAPSRSFLFIKDLESVMESFLRSNALPDTDRLESLIASFSGDRVEWEGKSRLLPCMSRVAVQSRDDGMCRIAASGARSVWDIRAFMRPVTERDVRNFLTETKTSPRSKSRAMILYLDGMDGNAKLLAKNLNIWTIGLKNINFMLDLHRQHKMIRLPNDRPEAPAPVPPILVGA